MRKQEREKVILQILDQNGAIDINDIENQCGVSAITARRDLEELDKRGYLVRTHGGAVKDDSTTHLFSFVKRKEKNAEKKIAIAEFASQFIHDDETIILDSGTTIYRLCNSIFKRKRLLVITNSLPVASELTKYQGIKIFLIGGEILPARKATFGPITSEHISQYHADKAFIGTDGISLKSGLTVRDVNEATRIKSMINSADKTYLLCDSSKIEKSSLYKLVPITAIDYLITDSGISDDIVELYKKNGINILIADIL
ncbi:MAG: DeoR/GlpR transcriptional regulator [Calditrichaeota bacterium]|nr:DeoR/GlpR transcriptional regulator [Calditrichota bacterium]